MQTDTATHFSLAATESNNTGLITTGHFYILGATILPESGSNISFQTYIAWLLRQIFKLINKWKDFLKKSTVVVLALLIAGQLSFLGVQKVHAAPVYDQVNGTYTDAFADATGIPTKNACFG